MSYLHKNDIEYNPLFFGETESLDTKQDEGHFDVFSTQMDNSNPFSKTTVKFLNKAEGKKHINSYFWQKLVSIEAKRQFKREVSLKSSLIKNQSLYNEAFNYFINELSSFHPNNLIIKITASDSLYFKFEVENNYIIRVEVFLDDQENFSDHHENTSLIIDNSGSQEYGYLGRPNDVLNKIKEFFSYDQSFESSSYQDEGLTFVEKEYSPTI